MVKVYLAYKFMQVLGQAISKACNFVYDENCTAGIIQKNYLLLE
jgi:hypothetical protein